MKPAEIPETKMTIQEKIAAHKAKPHNMFEDSRGSRFRTIERRDYAEFRNELTAKYGLGSVEGKLTATEDAKLKRLHAAKVAS